MVYADTVFVNGKVVTIDKNFSFKKAIGVKNGWIIDVGENADIKPYIGNKTEVIDLKGKIIMPGAHDAHAHGIVYGTNQLACDCSSKKVKSISDLKTQLAKEARGTPKGEWLRGAGLNYNTIEECKANPERGISRKDIDEVTPDHPVIILEWSGHGILVNSKALEVCQIGKNTPDPAHGSIKRDANGEPTGFFQEAEAMNLVSKNVPLWTDAELESAIMTFQKHLNKNGYTSYTESTLGPAGNERDSGAAGERGIGIYKKLQDEGLLTARVSVGLYTGISGIQSYQYMLADLENMKLPEITDENWFNIPMVKIFADGVHLDHSAWLLEDYADRSGFHGKSCLPGDDKEQAEELHKMIMLAHQKGYQVGIHTVGDRAIAESINGIIKAMNTFPGKNRRHYLIHAESMISNEMARRIAQYGIGISVQPGLVDNNLFEASIARIGKRGSRMFGLREIWAAGVVLAGGSDSLDGEYCHWRQAVQCAVTRCSHVTGKPYSPELAISLKEGLKLFTCNGAHQENFELVRGSIEIGKVADFQVLDQNIFQVDPEDLGSIEVELTMAGGKVVYSK